MTANFANNLLWRVVFALVVVFFTAFALFAQVSRPLVGPITINTANSATIPLTVRGASGHATDLQEWKAFDGTVLAGVAADGTISAPFSVPGSLPTSLLYVTTAGRVATLPTATYDVTSNDYTFASNLLSISGQLDLSGLGRLGGGLELLSNPGMGISSANTSRLRSNLGTLQVSNNGGAWADISNGLTGAGTANRLAYWTSSSALGALAANATNGQLPIGSTGAAPVVAALTGTANQIIVTNGAGSITLTTPQSIGTASTPTFSGIVLTTEAIANGSSLLPSLYGTSATTTGLYWNAAPYLGLTAGAGEKLRVDTTAMDAVCIYVGGSLQRITVVAGVLQTSGAC